MLCLIHGYGLSGSGSNLWTRAVVRALCENGETVHVVCRELRPEQYPYVAAAYDYDPAGAPTTLFERDAETPGRCLIHRPHIDILPVYVPPGDPKRMIRITDMTDAQVETFLGYATAALVRVIEDHSIEGMHVNHVVLMAQAAHRASQATGVPFGVMPHGSAIEYVVKLDPRMHRLATETLDAADRLFILNPEVRDRILTVFPGVADAESKMVTVPAGVDTRAFDLIPREQRTVYLGRIQQIVADQERGKTPEQTQALFDGLAADLSMQRFLDLVAETSDYPRRRPDADLDAKLDAIDGDRDEMLVFVGRLIGHKGVPTIFAAFPEILAARPQARLVVAGSGPLREVMEAFVWALANGQRTLARNLVEWGFALEGDVAEPFEPVARYFEQLEGEGRLEAYFEQAEALPLADRITFTGYLEHDALSLLFPCCDVGIFPSVVAEASPLIIPEAAASGCFPLGTDHAGMAASLDVIATALPPEAAALTRLRPDADHTVADLIDHAPRALDAGDAYREALRRLSVARYDWHSIAETLASTLRAMAA